MSPHSRRAMSTRRPPTRSSRVRIRRSEALLLAFALAADSAPGSAGAGAGAAPHPHDRTRGAWRVSARSGCVPRLGAGGVPRGAGRRSRRSRLTLRCEWRGVERGSRRGCRLGRRLALCERESNRSDQLAHRHLTTVSLEGDALARGNARQGDVHAHDDFVARNASVAIGWFPNVACRGRGRIDRCHRREALNPFFA